MHSLNLRNKFLYHNSHINNFVSALILRNLDVFGLVPLGVFGLLVDLLRGDGFRFSARFRFGMLSRSSFPDAIIVGLDSVV